MSPGQRPSHRFLVTGCGRSGTGYTATLFTTLGLPCGHEAVFNPYDLDRAEVFWPEDVPGESSWLAAPLLQHMPAGTKVLHQVRSHLEVVRSLVRIRLFDEPSPYRQFAEDLCPQLATGTALEQSALYWLHWNQIVEEGARAAGLPYMRYRLEDYGPELVDALLEFIEVSIADGQVQTALAERPRDVNTRGDKSQDATVSLDTLDPSLVNQLTAQARRYGYA